jgi:hypothetical protein
MLVTVSVTLAMTHCTGAAPQCFVCAASGQPGEPHCWAPGPGRWVVVLQESTPPGMCTYPA